MAHRFVPELTDASDPIAVEAWARAVSDVINGQVSIGEPVSENTTMFPNGVQGNVRGSFCVGQITASPAPVVFVHNLNIPALGTAAPPLYTDPLNVAWQIVRVRHDGTGAAGLGGCGASAVFRGGLFSLGPTGIILYCSLTHCTVDAVHPAIFELFFFPTTR
jgi:hypothetical protein